MACLVKEENGYYYIRLWLPFLKKTKKISTSSKNKKEALKLFNKVAYREKQYVVERKAFGALYEDWLNSNGEEVGEDRSRFKLSDIITKYLDSCKNRISILTIKSYAVGLTDMTNALKDDIQMVEIRRGDYDTILTYLKGRYSDTTVNIRLRGIRAFLNWSVENEYLEKMPFKVKMAPVKKRLPKFITPEEMKAIYANVNDPILVSIYKVYEATGMRLSELNSSKLEEDKFLRIVGKGDKERIVPIPKVLLNDYHIAKDAEYKTDRITRSFTKAIKNAGIKGEKTLHSLRHTFALRMLVELGDIYLVKKLLGHSSITVTEVYTKFPEEYLKQVFDEKANGDQVQATA
ncbi:MAG: tyrosine-type recombinase/integrase [Nitrospinota bacterium]|nr:tyrosine-type recombinase/integrase [Nitrospinota bacterium]